MKVNSFALVSLGLILIAAVAVSFLLAKTATLTHQKELPVFMGEEFVVGKIIVEPVVQPKVQVQAKEQAIPAPVPEMATPLPIFPPRISYRVLPEYPISALEQELEGTVLVSVYVGATGIAEDVKVKSSSGIAALDESAVKAVSQWIFSPASQGGRAIASWYELPVRYNLK